jgi:hypothetical protein
VGGGVSSALSAQEERNRRGKRIGRMGERESGLDILRFD